MDEKMMARLAGLQAKIAHYNRLASQLAAAAPQQAEGADPSGHVTIRLDRTGLPLSVRVRSGWQRHIAPEHLGDAVVQANTAAIQQGMAAFSQALHDSGWQGRQGAPQVLSETPPEPSRGTARDLPEITENAIAALAKVQQAPSPAGEEQATGTDRSGQVSVSLSSSGLSSCRVGARWAASRDAEAISAALQAAISTARSTIGTPASSPDGTDGLLGDALATLRALTQQTPLPKEPS